MDEQTWMMGNQAWDMLNHVKKTKPRGYERKIRLLACGYVRFHCQRLTYIEPLIAAEKYTDGLISTYELHGARYQPNIDPICAILCNKFNILGNLLRYYSSFSHDRDMLAVFLRDLFGNLYRPTVIDPDWLSLPVIGIAESAYQHRMKVQCINCKAGLTFNPIKIVKCSLCDGTGEHEGVYLESDRLSILADALEDSGCTNGIILYELRHGLHIRGYWVIDTIRSMT